MRARETHHTTAAQAAQIALNAEVKQLVIGHFSARYEDESVLLNEAAAIFPQTVLARENMCITINNYTDTRDYDPYNEREVLKLLQEESTQRKGFELIVAQYSEQLYWQIRRMVLSHEDANDLLQNTFIKAWTNIDYFRAEAKLSTWLYRIALNECLTFLNRQRATTTVAIDDPEAAIVQKLESDPYYSGDQVQMLLQKALLTLPEKQRMVFNLKYYQEMKYEEMSEIFGTSVGALKASYHHAVKKIEKFLEEVD